MNGYKDSSSRETKDQLRAKLLESERLRLDLETRVIALEKRFAGKHGYDDPTPQKPIDGVSRNYRGEVIVPEDTPSRDERIAARKAAAEAEAKALEAALTEGLPAGFFRDGSLIRRKSDGTIVSPADIESIAADQQKPKRLNGHQKAVQAHRQRNAQFKGSKVTEKPEAKVDVFHAYDPLTGETAYNEDMD